MNSNTHRILFPFAFVLIFLQPSFGQDPPIKWGEIPREDLEMKSFPRDPNASVLVLCDYGESSFNDDFDVVFKRHLRVKILTKKGYDWGTFSFQLANGKISERMRGIEGATYSLDGQGAVVKNELSDKDIYKEDLDNKRKICRFTLPALKQGCVFEVRYQTITNSIYYLPDWHFQKSEPVRWSEYRIRAPKNISYAFMTMGYEPYTVKDLTLASQSFSGYAGTILGKGPSSCNQMRWVTQNLPALRDEPYITTLDDYANRIMVQLAEYTFGQPHPLDVLKTWDALLQELLESNNFGGRVDVTRRVRKLTEEVTAGLTSPEAKLRAIFKWVSSSIVWTGENRIFSSKDINDVIDAKKGSNAETVFLILSMLKSTGIDGNPVILSTRSNGMIQDLYPMMDQFDYVLAKVDMGSRSYFVDATDPDRPLDLLPSKVLNVKGLVVKEGSPEWVTIACAKSDVLRSYATLSVHNDGYVSAALVDSMIDYGAYRERQDLTDKNDVDVIKESFETETLGLTVDSTHIDGKDSINDPLVYKAWVSSPMYAQGNGEYVYINPQILHRTTTNPFKREDRRFPVDFSFKRSFDYTVMLTAPDSFEVKETIPEKSLSVGSDLVTYKRSVMRNLRTMLVRTQYRVNETTIGAKYYKELKEMFAKIITAEQEQCVLGRVHQTPPPAKLETIKPSKSKGGKKR